MNAERTDNKTDKNEGSMKGAFIKSSIFHAVIVVIALVGIPFVKKEPVIIAPVSVELVDLSELSQTEKKPPPKAKPIPKPKEPKKIEPPKPPKEDLKKPDPVPVPKPEPKKEPEKPKKPEKAKPKPKPEKPKEKPKPEQEDLFKSLLKDLTPKEKEAQQQKEETLEPDDGQKAPIANQISMSELDALRAQIEPCWNVPSGAKYAENLVVTLRLAMNRDMTVRSARVINGRSDPAFRAAADSALRAVRNPRCSPLRLPPEKYEQWKTIVINFDPSDML